MKKSYKFQSHRVRKGDLNIRRIWPDDILISVFQSHRVRKGDLNVNVRQNCGRKIWKLCFNLIE